MNEDNPIGAPVALSPKMKGDVISLFIQSGFLFPENPHTDKKENKIFLICKEIQKGAVAKSYMYEEGPGRRYSWRGPLSRT